MKVLSSNHSIVKKLKVVNTYPITLKFKETMKTIANMTAMFFLGIKSEASRRGICKKKKGYLT